MIKLADTLAPLADFPAAYAKDIEFDDGKNLQEKLNNGELGGGGTSITVDTAMSSTSTNLVQNKVIKAYVDGKSVDISADSDNAIQTKTDGIYVEKTKISTDDGNALSKKSDGLFVEDLSNKVNALNIAQKTINEDLDYCFVGFWNNTNSEVHATCTRGAAIPFNTKFEGNLDFNSTNKAIKLKAGHRYKLHYQCKQTGTTVNANHMERFYNETTSEWLKMACNCDTEDETHTMEEIYVPTVDCEVSVRNCWCPVASFSMRVNCVNTNPDGPGLKTIDCESAFIVTEIGKTVTIDPVEYVDSTKGIEDTPVGHIIPYMGNNAPKHYLICDGGEYNIVDYPYLAQHFTDEFGSVNYFGGDGTTTFAVPDLRGEFLRGTGTNSHANQGSGATVGEHQDGTDIPVIAQYIANDTAYLYTPGRKTERYPHEMDSVLIEGYTGFNTVRLERAEQGNNTTDIRRESITTRPTNTSVLYCIKYEPTYFMVLQPTGYDTLDVDCGAINVSLEASNTAIRTLWTYTNNNTNGQPIKINLRNLVATTNTGSDEGYITVDIDGVESQRVQCPTSTNTLITIPKFDLQPSETFSIKTDWVNTHTSVTWKLSGRFTTLTNSI